MVIVFLFVYQLAVKGEMPQAPKGELVEKEKEYQFILFKTLEL